MIDDVHSDPDFLVTMQHMRDEIDRDISFVMTCWTGAQNEIELILNTSPQQVHVLRRLTQDQIACVLKNTGLTGNHQLINEIIRQAEGLPGLAGTLACLALQGDWKKIHTAEPLSSTILSFYERRLGGTVRGILACFALGGNFGMSKHTLATELTIPPLDLQHMLSVLAGGGIVTGVANLPDNIKVRPSALRHILINTIFFSGPASLSASLRKSPTRTNTKSQGYRCRTHQGQS